MAQAGLTRLHRHAQVPHQVLWCTLREMLAYSGPYREQDCRSSKSDSLFVPTAGCHVMRDGTFTLLPATYGLSGFLLRPREGTLQGHHQSKQPGIC